MPVRLLLIAMISGIWAHTGGAQPDPLLRPLPPAAAGTETLGRFLRDIGFEPKALSPDVYQLVIERERWPVYVMLSLSTDGKRIWLESKFAPIDDPERVPPAAWKKLLETNEKIGPAHFAYDERDKRIHLYKTFDNSGLTTERLRHEIEQFDLTVRKTQDVWRGDNFKPVIGSTAPTMPIASAQKNAAVPAVPVAREISADQRLLADWRVVEIQVNGRKTPDESVRQRQPSISFRHARDADFGPAVQGKLMADLKTGPDSSRTVRVVLNSVPTADGVHAIDFIDEHERVEQGIYRLDGNSLNLCFALAGERRPVGFAATPGKRSWVLMLKK